MACLAYKKNPTKPKTKQKHLPKLTAKKKKKNHVDRILLRYRRRKELFKVSDNIGKVNTLLSNLGWKKVIH